eukprot:Hpha_TRINITY_DN347_c0_g1::TRINITY_DN347_c0_g1_i1::g.112763::m.112763
MVLGLCRSAFDYVKSFCATWLLRYLACLVQSFMLLQVSFFYVLLRWRVLSRRRAGRAPSVTVASSSLADGQISVVVMAKNEEKGIVQFFETLAQRVSRPDLLEVVFVDNGSTDGTLATAQASASGLPFPLRITKATGGRGAALDAGVAVAQGSILMVLHADCVPPQGFDELVRAGLDKPGALATAFLFGINRTQLPAPLPGMSIMEVTINIRSKSLQLPFGDQGIALRKDKLVALGGYGGAEYPLMEDFQLVQKLRNEHAMGLGNIVIIDQPVLCSPRRWVRLGVWRVNLVNQLVMLWYRRGATPQQLFDFYYGRRTDQVPWVLLALTQSARPKPAVGAGTKKE